MRPNGLNWIIPCGVLFGALTLAGCDDQPAGPGAPETQQTDPTVTEPEQPLNGQGDLYEPAAPGTQQQGTQPDSGMGTGTGGGMGAGMGGGTGGGTGTGELDGGQMGTDQQQVPMDSPYDEGTQQDGSALPQEDEPLPTRP